MTDTDSQARVAELEQKLGAMVARWNDFVGGPGAVTRPRIAGIERRLGEMVATWNESVDNRKEVAKLRHEALKKLAEAVRDRFEAVESRMDAVEERGLRFCGVYQRAAKYGRGDVVVADGSLWCSLAESDGVKPGTDETKWQLCVTSAR